MPVTPTPHKRKALAPGAYQTDNARYNGPTTDRPESWNPAPTYAPRTPGGKVVSAPVRRTAVQSTLAAPVRTDAINANAQRYLASAGERMENRIKVNNMPLTAVDGRNQVYAPGIYNGNTIVATGNASFRGYAPGGGFSLNGRGLGSSSGGAGGTGGGFGAVGGQVGGGYAGGATGVRGVRGGYGYGGGGGLRGASGDIGRQLQADLDRANAANEARYNQALDENRQGQKAQQAALEGAYGNVYQTLGGLTNTIGGTKAEAMGFLSDLYGQQNALAGTLGGTAHEQERRRLAQQQGATVSSLNGRGLGNSTVVDSMRRGNETDSQFVHQGIDEANARLRLGIMGQYAGQGANIISDAGRQQVAATGQLAGAYQDFARQQLQAQQYGQGQRIGIIESRSDEGPNIGAYLQALSQPGAFGGYGAAGAAGGVPGGGSGSDGMELLLEYLRGQQGGGPQQAPGDFTPDPRTVANNQNAGYYKPGGAYNNSGGAAGPTNLLGELGGGGSTGNVYGGGGTPYNLIDAIPGGGGSQAPGVTILTGADGRRYRLNVDGTRDVEVSPGNWERIG